MTDKILIGVVTADIKDYCYPAFKSQLQRLQKKGFDVYIVDNSVRPTNRSFPSVSVKPHQISQVTTAHCMNMLRDYFLKGDWDKLWVLESDVFVTDEAVDNLINMKGDVNNYTYPMRLERYNKYSLCVQSTIANRSLMLDPDESQLLLNNGIITMNEFKLNGKVVTHTGYGCTLISRKVLEAVNFKTAKSGDNYPYPDSFFHYEVNEKGFVNLLDTDYICEHRNLKGETKKAIEMKSLSRYSRADRRKIMKEWKK